jgi:hypothetical protein
VSIFALLDVLAITFAGDVLSSLFSAIKSFIPATPLSSMLAEIVKAGPVLKLIVKIISVLSLFYGRIGEDIQILDAGNFFISFSSKKLYLYLANMVKYRGY